VRLQLILSQIFSPVNSGYSGGTHSQVIEPRDFGTLVHLCHRKE